MKILVSSKQLLYYVKKRGLNIITKVSVDHQKFFFVFFGDKMCFFRVETTDKNISCDTENVRWDWIEKDLEALSDRPIIIEFDHNKANIKLSYSN